MKKILVTGGCGFIGSNFIRNQLLKTNNIILNIDKLTYSSNKDNIKTIDNLSNYSFLEADIADVNLIRSTFRKFAPSCIINFAAETHVDRSIDSPDSFIDTNIIGTLNLLKASLEYFMTNKKFKFVHVSTDEVYGSLDLNSKSFVEASPYRPNSPYSASKASSDHLVRAWHKTYGLPTIISNCSNNYGPYQFPEKLIPLVIANCLNEKSIPVYGDGSNLRDWIYVDDHCNALDLIIEKGLAGEKYLIGGDNEIKNIDIINKICSILNSLKPRKNNNNYEELITFVKDRPGHDFRYAVNSTKIQKNLGWKPLQTFESGLELTIKWYLGNTNWLNNILHKKYNLERLGLKNS